MCVCIYTDTHIFIYMCVCVCVCVFYRYTYLGILKPGFQRLLIFFFLSICVKNTLRKKIFSAKWKYLCKSSTIKSNTVLIIRSAVGEARSHNWTQIRRNICWMGWQVVPEKERTISWSNFAWTWRCMLHNFRVLSATDISCGSMTC